MPYTKTTWVNGGAPPISQANLNNLETQYDEAIADLARKLKPALVRWVIPGWYNNNGVATLVTANRIYYTPIRVVEPTTYIRIGAYVSVQAVGTADLRIFEWNNGVPGALILSAGTINTNILGANEIVIAQLLNEGYYFLACRCTATPQLAGPAPTVALKPPVDGFKNGHGAAAISYVVLTVDAVYADPAPAPTAGAAANYAHVQMREN